MDGGSIMLNKRKMSFEGMKIILRILLLSYFKPLAVVKRKFLFQAHHINLPVTNCTALMKKREEKREKSSIHFVKIQD